MGLFFRACPARCPSAQGTLHEANSAHAFMVMAQLQSWAGPSHQPYL